MGGDGAKMTRENAAKGRAGQPPLAHREVVVLCDLHERDYAWVLTALGCWDWHVPVAIASGEGAARGEKCAPVKGKRYGRAPGAIRRSTNAGRGRSVVGAGIAWVVGTANQVLEAGEAAVPFVGIGRRSGKGGGALFVSVRETPKPAAASLNRAAPGCR